MVTSFMFVVVTVFGRFGAFAFTFTLAFLDEGSFGLLSFLLAFGLGFTALLLFLSVLLALLALLALLLRLLSFAIVAFLIVVATLVGTFGTFSFTFFIVATHHLAHFLLSHLLKSSTVVLDVFSSVPLVVFFGSSPLFPFVLALDADTESGHHEFLLVTVFTVVLHSSLSSHVALLIVAEILEVSHFFLAERISAHHVLHHFHVGRTIMVTSFMFVVVTVF